MSSSGWDLLHDTDKTSSSKPQTDGPQPSSLPLPLALCKLLCISFELTLFGVGLPHDGAVIVLGRRPPVLYPSCCRHVHTDAAAHVGGHKRAAGVPLLPADLQLLLLPQTALPGQARAVGHAVRLRVLPPQVQDQELADDAQEPAAPRLQRHAQAAAQDDGHQGRAGAAPGPAAAAQTAVNGRRAEAYTATPTTSTKSLFLIVYLQESYFNDIFFMYFLMMCAVPVTSYTHSRRGTRS